MLDRIGIILFLIILGWIGMALIDRGASRDVATAIIFGSFMISLSILFASNKKDDKK